MARISKAIIPVAGYGTRRLPMTKAIEKSMLPIGDRPLVDYAVSECIKAGIKDIYFVINKTLGAQAQIETYYGENALLTEFLEARNASEKLAKLKTAPEDVRFHYIVQDPNAAYGTAVPVALFMAEVAAGKIGLSEGESVAFANGDDFFWDGGKTSEMAEFVSQIKDGEAAIIGVEYPKEQIPNFGMIENGGGLMSGLVEKPSVDKVTSTLINVNRFVLSPELLEEIVSYVERNNFSPLEQEYMITDPILDFVKKGNKVRVIKAKSEWLDGGSLEGWFKANRVVLGK
ncbi:sugar phosphate nucleotidyltransferase [Candidatus Saccharibacteria bacterium]|nr:sugar phosphate nucleotidyltransferase [Candidatus Saccharibacteria bacterium]